MMDVSFSFSDCFVFCPAKQSSGKSSVLESIVGRDFLPRGSGEAFDLLGFTSSSIV